MKIVQFYNGSTLEGRLSAYLVHKKYYGLFDSNGSMNTITSYDCNGVAYLTIQADIYALSAGYYHRAFNFLADGVGVGQMTAVDITALQAKLIGSATDDLSDDFVVTVLPASFSAGTLYNTRNQVQIVWNGLYGFKLNPVDRGRATSGGATTLVDTGKTWTSGAYVNKYVYILGGIGRGQWRKITGNTSNTLTVAAWSVNPNSTSVYYVTNYPPRNYPNAVLMLGGEFAQINYGTASGGSSSTIVQAGAGWTIDAYIGKYVYVWVGTGIGGHGRITDNDGTTLTVPSGLTATADGTTKFVIVNTEAEVFLMMYYKWFMWMYASRITVGSDLNLLDNLFDYYGNLYQMDLGFDAPENVAYITSDVKPKGKAAFDASVSALA